MDKEKLIKDLMEATGWTKEKTEDTISVLNFEEFLKELGNKWNNLDENSQKWISKIMAGKKSSEEFKVVLDNAVDSTIDNTHEIGTTMKKFTKRVHNLNN